MNTMISIEDYGPVINREQIGEEILHIITEALSMNDVLEIKVGTIRFMTTFCAKQIFGSLYKQLGPKDYYRRILFVNPSDGFMSSINLALEKASIDK